MNNVFAAAAAGVLALFGFAGDRVTTSTANFNQGSSTHKEQRDTRVGSTTRPTFNISCVSTAVAARESSLDAAVSTYTTGINSAYTARATALASAYAQTGNVAIRAAVKAAWQQFASATQGSKRAWQKSRENAWATFRTAVKACGPNATAVADTSNASAEVSGQ
jgi:hypothetical protein